MATVEELIPIKPKPSDEWNVERIRKDFPVLTQTVNGKPLVYLDNAATSQKPQAVIDALTTYYARDNANVHRGVHLLSERATEAYESARDRIKRHLNAASRREIVFAAGADPQSPAASGFAVMRVERYSERRDSRVAGGTWCGDRCTVDLEI